MITTRNARSLVVTLLMAVMCTPVFPQSANAGSHDDPDAIIGTWLTTVDPGPDAPPFPQLLTFNEGGTAMQSAAGPPIPALGNPGHGVWKRISRNKVAATFIQFTFDETLVKLTGSLKISILATLNEAGNKITTKDEVTIYDVEGNEIVTLTGTQTGRRLRVEVVH